MEIPALVATIAPTQSPGTSAIQKEFAFDTVCPNPCRAIFRLRNRFRACEQPPGDIRFSFPNLRICRSVVAGLLLGGWVASAALPAPTLEADHLADPETGLRVSDDGTVDLSWSLPGADAAAAEESATTYQLEQSPNADFADSKLRYEGPDLASVLTGLREGQYHFRVRATDPESGAGTWSEPLTLHVKFMDRGQLALLLVTGALVATMTIGAIISGFLKNR